MSSVKLELEAYKMMGKKPTAIASIAGIIEAAGSDEQKEKAS